ncbi:MAG: hypothetical protein G01um10145_819 [Microgenomates group bacterium Gr01-1014_5]|nr:MAG: hypothetical protein G01um10145_819 [Microgenomates group bacterium Gr01-1014_5]
MWFCFCGEDPCMCTEEHKLGKCKKYQHGICAECKTSNVIRFMTGLNCTSVPILEEQEIPELLEITRKTGLQPPILGMRSTK